MMAVEVEVGTVKIGIAVKALTGKNDLVFEDIFALLDFLQRFLFFGCEIGFCLEFFYVSLFRLLKVLCLRSGSHKS